MPRQRGWQLGELQRRELRRRRPTPRQPGPARVRRLPTSGRCWPAGSAADRPGRTSAPATSPSAPWCRCGRCRTGWSACSGSTTGCSRAAAHPDGDDVLARDPLVGERDRRGEDRQLLLDALLAATEHLVHHLHRRRRAHRRASGRRRCRSASCWTRSTTPRATPTATRSATRSSSDIRCSRSTPATSPPRPRPRPAVQLRPRRAGRRPRAARRAAAAAAVPAGAAARRRPSRLDLDRLVALLQNPATGFLRQRLDVAVPYRGGRARRRDPGRAGRLAEVGRRRPAARATGWPAIDDDELLQAEWLRGALPPGPLGAARCRRGRRGRADWSTRPPGSGRRSARRSTSGSRWTAGRCWGTVGGRARPHAADRDLQQAVGQGPARRLDPAGRTHRRPAGRRLDRAHRRPRAPESVAPRPAGPRARPRHTLAQLVQLYRRGLREPLPLPVKTGSAYAEARIRFRQQRARGAGQGPQRWATGQGTSQGGRATPRTSRSGDRSCPFETLVAERPHPDERWSDDGTRFGQLAIRLWKPLLAAERLEQL